MSETIDVDELITRLHQMNGHRIALMKQFAEEDPKDLLRVYGESVAFTGLIRGLENYREEGDLGQPPDDGKFEAYEQMSRSMLRADDLASVEPDDEPERMSFQ